MSKDEVDTAIGALEAWGRTEDNWILICAAGVALFLAFEVFFSVAHWRNESKLRPLRVLQSQIHEIELIQLTNDTAEANKRAAEANRKAETEQVERLKLELELRAKAASLAEALRDGAIANSSTAALIHQALLKLGLINSEQMSEAARSFQIIPKVSPFAGKQFDAAVTSKDIVPGVLLGSLKNALKAAGWIEVETGVDKDTFLRKPMNVDVVASLVEIHVDASKAPELLNAAEALASALNAEGIAATVNPKTEIDVTNVIHILVGPKP